MNALRDWLRSFRFAYEGLKHAFATQRNMKFHFFSAMLVLLTAVVLGLGKRDILFLLLAVSLVVMAELFNTAVEKAVDLAMPELHPKAKIAKDVAAGAVLVASLFAVAVGLIVFYDPTLELLARMRTDRPLTAGSVFLYLTLVALAVVVLQTRFSRGRFPRPSLWTAISFATSTLIGLTAQVPLAALLGFGLSAMLTALLYERGGREPVGLLFGGVLGTVITIVAYWLSRL